MARTLASSRLAVIAGLTDMLVIRSIHVIAELIGCTPQGGPEAQSSAIIPAAAASRSLVGTARRSLSPDRCPEVPEQIGALLARSRPEIGSFAKSILACAVMAGPPRLGFLERWFYTSQLA